MAHLLGVVISGRLQGQIVQAYPCGKSEDSKGVIRIRKWKDRQYHDQNKRTNNDLQSITQKT
jgi:hypothetical protein